MRVSDFMSPEENLRLVKQLQAEYREASLAGDYRRLALGNFPSGKAIMALSPEAKAHLAVLLVRDYLERVSPMMYVHGMSSGDLAALLMRALLPIDPDELAELIRLRCNNAGWWAALDSALLRHAAEHRSHPGVLAAVEEWMKATCTTPPEDEMVHERKVRHEFERALTGVTRDMQATAADWQVELARILGDSTYALIATAKSKEPTAKWLSQAGERMPPEAAIHRAAESVTAFLRSAETPVPAESSDVLRGLAWLIERSAAPARAEWLGDLAAAAGRKIPGFGSPSQKLFIAAVLALGRIGTPEALAALARIRPRMRAGQNLDLIVNTLTEAAYREGVALEELEELIVPTFDLEPPGVKRVESGGGVATLQIGSDGSVEIVFVNGSGKQVKTLPKTTEVDALKKERKAIKEAMITQRERLDRLMAISRILPYAIWRERYSDHPLMANLTRRLIWVIDGTPCALRGETFVDADGAEIPEPADQAPVRLWHPIDALPETVRAWREWVEQHGVTQPFKQAHREVYVPTRDELDGSETLRFAGHVLRQHQMAAVMRSAGWKYALQGWWDGVNAPRREFGNLTLEWEIDLADTGEETYGIARFAKSGAARFLRGVEPVPLADVPALTFSEGMRDLDMFVAVASATHNPSFDVSDVPYAPGALTQTAQTRGEVLTRLFNRIGLEDKARVDGRYVEVHGSRALYRIHLGSGNVFVEPNNRFIALEVTSTNDVALPFEGDPTLARIVSLARALANDDAIADPFLREQIAGA